MSGSGERTTDGGSVVRVISAHTGGTIKRERTIGLLCGIAVIMLFSSFTLVSRLGFSSSLHLLDLAALRFCIAGVLMTPVLWHYGLSSIRWREAAALASFGGLGFALLALLGFSLAPASHAGVLLHGTLVLTTFVLAWITWRRGVTGRRALGLFAILTGVIAMVWDSAAAMSARQMLGDGALLAASICWSAYGLLAARLRLRPAHSASIVAVLSMCCFVPLYLILPGTGHTLLAASARDLIIQATFQGLLVGTASIYVYSRAVASLGALGTALFTTAVPCVTTVAAVFLFSEIPSVTAMIGVLTVTAGMAIAINGNQ